MLRSRKAEIFELISDAWQPGKGDVIKLMKRADVNLSRLAAKSGSSDALQFAPDETTPSLLDGEVFVTGENTKATAITNFTDAEAESFTRFTETVLKMLLPLPAVETLF